MSPEQIDKTKQVPNPAAVTAPGKSSGTVSERADIARIPNPIERQLNSGILKPGGQDTIVPGAIGGSFVAPGGQAKEEIPKGYRGKEAVERFIYELMGIATKDFRITEQNGEIKVTNNSDPSKAITLSSEKGFTLKQLQEIGIEKKGSSQKLKDGFFYYVAAKMYDADEWYKLDPKDKDEINLSEIEGFWDGMSANKTLLKRDISLVEIGKDFNQYGMLYSSIDKEALEKETKAIADGYSIADVKPVSGEEAYKLAAQKISGDPNAKSTALLKSLLDSQARKKYKNKFGDLNMDQQKKIASTIPLFKILQAHYSNEEMVKIFGSHDKDEDKEDLELIRSLPKSWLKFQGLDKVIYDGNWYKRLVDIPGKKLVDFEKDEIRKASLRGDLPRGDLGLGS